MAITPLIPSSGLSGWTFLKATLDRQTEVFDRSADIKADIEHFDDSLKNGMTLEDFISDRRLRRVALSAFGLGDEVDKGAFVRKILEEGTESQSAFAVRLNNAQYLDFAAAFDFTDGTLNLTRGRSEIIQKYKDEMFEQGLDEVDGSLRLALNFEREIGDISSRSDLSEQAQWFQVMGSQPLRAVIEGAFNLPTAFSQIDIDRQAEVFADKAEQLLGTRSVSAFEDPEIVERVIQRYMLNQQINSGPSATTPGYSALSLLTGGLGTASLTSLIASF